LSAGKLGQHARKSRDYEFEQYHCPATQTTQPTHQALATWPIPIVFVRTYHLDVPSLLTVPYLLTLTVSILHVINSTCSITLLHETALLREVHVHVFRCLRHSSYTSWIGTLRLFRTQALGSSVQYTSYEPLLTNQTL